jgi:hypothetical protein
MNKHYRGDEAGDANTAGEGLDSSCAKNRETAISTTASKSMTNCLAFELDCEAGCIIQS